MRVVIVEDVPLVLDALATSLATQQIDVVARARDATEAIAAIDRVAPDVALLDIRLPPDFTDEGLRLAEQVRSLYPSVGILVLSSYAEAAYAERLVSMEQETRAVGYLLKERVGDVIELLGALRRVSAGDVVIDPYVISRLMSRRRQHDPLAVLSAQERRILALVAEGRSNLGIAQATGCRITTVEKHLSTITTKLGLADGTDRRGVNVRVLATLEYLRGNQPR